MELEFFNKQAYIAVAKSLDAETPPTIGDFKKLIYKHYGTSKELKIILNIVTKYAGIGGYYQILNLLDEVLYGLDKILRERV